MFAPGQSAFGARSLAILLLRERGRTCQLMLSEQPRPADQNRTIE